jgi:large subunit ribosomal protein L24
MPKLTKALKKGVTVKVISGREKNKSGKVIEVLWSKNRVRIEKVNMQKRHKKPSATNKAGGIVEQEGTVHISNVVLLEAVKAAVKAEKPAKATKAKAAAKGA